MRLGIHVPEIAKTPATIGHVVYRGRLALYLGSSLSSLGMRLFVGQEEMDLCMGIGSCITHTILEAVCAKVALVPGQVFKCHVCMATTLRILVHTCICTHVDCMSLV